MAKAYFDRVNSQGGIDGRMIEYQIEDDKGAPATSALAVRRLVGSGVVALVGGTSVAECGVAQPILEQSGVLELNNGALPACFESPNIAPTNVGLFPSVAALLDYAVDELDAQRPCLIGPLLPGLTEGQQQVAADWQEARGRELALVDISVNLGDDPTPAVVKAKQAGCDAIASAGDPVYMTALLKAARAQDVSADTAWLGVSSNYTPEWGENFAQEGVPGMYVAAEYEPFTGEPATLEDFRELAEANGLEQTAFGISGYLQAEILTTAMESIEGDIDRESVTAALQSIEDYETPLMGTPISLAPADGHHPNNAIKMVRNNPDGSWQVVTPDWIPLRGME